MVGKKSLDLSPLKTLRFLIEPYSLLYIGSKTNLRGLGSSLPTTDLSYKLISFKKGDKFMESSNFSVLQFYKQATLFFHLVYCYEKFHINDVNLPIFPEAGSRVSWICLFHRPNKFFTFFMKTRDLFNYVKGTFSWSTSPHILFQSGFFLFIVQPAWKSYFGQSLLGFAVWYYKEIWGCSFAGVTSSLIGQGNAILQDGNAAGACM